MTLYQNDSYVTTLTQTAGATVNTGDDSGNQGSNTSVVGTWSGTEEGGYDQLVVTVKADGTGTYVLTDKGYYSTYDTSAGSLTYVMEGTSRGKVYIKINSSYYSDRIAEYFFVIEGNKMYLYEDGYGDDLEWVLTKQ